jgi:hypothetical protein
MPKSTVRLGKRKAGLSAKGNQMSTTDVLPEHGI